LGGWLKDPENPLSGTTRATSSAPSLLSELSAAPGEVERKLDPAKASWEGPELTMDEASFRWMMNEEAMATEKLAEGIRGFAKDIVKLEDIIRTRL
jgi:transaldolase